jgi:hypothetical protein
VSSRTRYGIDFIRTSYPNISIRVCLRSRHPRGVHPSTLAGSVLPSRGVSVRFVSARTSIPVFERRRTGESERRRVDPSRGLDRSFRSGTTTGSLSKREIGCRRGRLWRVFARWIVRVLWITAVGTSSLHVSEPLRTHEKLIIYTLTRLSGGPRPGSDWIGATHSTNAPPPTTGTRRGLRRSDRRRRHRVRDDRRAEESGTNPCRRRRADGSPGDEPATAPLCSPVRTLIP